MTIWTDAFDLLTAAQTVLIVTHPKPDGDAIGSLLGLGNQIRKMGKQVTCAVDEGVPPYLKFLPFSETVVSTLDKGEWDLLITTDIADATRGGKVGDYGIQHSKRHLNIDHHPTNPLFGDVAMVFPNAVSATEVVYDWWEATGQSCEQEVAVPLLTGIITDTQGFRTSNTTPRTLELAMRLMQKGASLTEISARTLESKNAQEFQLWKMMLPSAELEGKVAYGMVTLAQAAKVGMNDTTDAGLVQFLVNIEEAMVAVMFKERPNGQVTLSMRAKRGYNVAEVATQFGGGGHIQAAGATIDGTIDEIKAKVMPLLHEAVRKGKLDIV
jgi:phosphoesterase RecJ-like protein